MKFSENEVFKALLREKLVLPVVFLSVFIKRRGSKDPMLKIARQSLKSLWEIVKILKD